MHMPSTTRTFLAAIAVAALMAGPAGARAASPPPLSVSATPSSVPSGGSTVLTFKVKATRRATGKLLVGVPAGWSSPKARGAVSVARGGCPGTAAARPAVTGKGPWTVAVTFTCKAGKAFTITYRGTAPSAASTFPVKVALRGANGRLGAPRSLPTSPRVGVDAPVAGQSGPPGQPLAPVPAPAPEPAPAPATPTPAAPATATPEPVTPAPVPPATAAKFVVTGVADPAPAGSAQSMTVKAVSVDGEVVPTYTGTVHFSSTDARASLPQDAAFTAADAGVLTLPDAVVLRSPGDHTVTISDGELTGVQAFGVVPGPASHFAVTGIAAPVTSGESDTITITALDSAENVATGYRGTAHLTSDDPHATLPADVTFTEQDNGVAEVAGVTLRSPGERSVLAGDGDIQGTLPVTVSNLLHVAKSGSDAALGGPATPMRTINSAVARAATTTPQLKVLVAGGDYDEGTGVELADGVLIEGGKSADTWDPGATPTKIIGSPQAVTASSDQGAGLADVTLAPTTPTAAGSSVIGARILSASDVTLTRIKVQVPPARDGAPGDAGQNGANAGATGAQGANATGTDPVYNGDGGAGGATVVKGGAGGPGGVIDYFNGAPGDPGSYSGQTPGGEGGFGGYASESSDGRPGGPGVNGWKGAAGNGGAGGASGTIDASGWVASSGLAGTDASAGSGGGGGGGGGDAKAYSIWTGGYSTVGAAGGGGGGGGGGDGGTAGKGGRAGGGSFGILMLGSKVTIAASTVTVGAGGTGGAGGPGGSGAPGGSGGSGGTGNIRQGHTRRGGHGGSGGFGGFGGTGGGGGGGRGGPSIAISKGGSSYVDGGGNVLSHGAAGAGGPGGKNPDTPAANGQDGTAGPAGAVL